MARSYGEGSIILRIWHLQYSHRGQVCKESSRSTDRKVATRLLRKRLSGQRLLSKFRNLELE